MPGFDSSSYEWIQYLNDELHASRFASIDALLTDLDVYKLNSEVLISILTITRFAKPHLTCRDAFLYRAETRLNSLDGIEETQRLLKTRR